MRRAKDPKSKAPPCPKCGSLKAYYSDDWYIAYTFDGKEKLLAISPHKEFAERELTKVLYEIQQRIHDPNSKAETLPWESAVKLFNKFLLENKKTETARFYRDHLRTLDRYLPHHPLETVTASHLRAYVALRSETVSRTTIKHEVKTFTYMLNCFLKGRIVDDREQRYITRTQLLEFVSPAPNDSKDEYWTSEEIKLLLQHAKHKYLPGYILLGCNAALRKRTIRFMRKEYVDLANNRLILPASTRKRGKYTHFVEMSKRLREEIEKLMVMNESVWLFPGTKDTPWWQFDIHWSALKVKVGVNKRFHDLKHTAGTLYYEATEDIYATAEFLDHADINMTRRYVRMLDKKRKADMSKFEQMFDTNVK